MARTRKPSAAKKPSKTIAVSKDNIQTIREKLAFARTEADLIGRTRIVELLDDVAREMDELFFTPARNE